MLFCHIIHFSGEPMLDVKNSVIDAKAKIGHYIKPTPLIYSHSLSLLTKVNVYLKLENIQPTGSFKVRGAFNKILSLSSKEKNAGVIAASTGNHGAAVAYACYQLQVEATVFVPKNASPAKVNNIKSYGADVKFFGNECGETEKHARAYAEQHEKIYISPYNDFAVIAGQGTIGYELLQQLEDINAIFASVGGAGLISGIGGYVKAMNKKIEIVGCLPENSPAMLECIKADKMLELDCRPTLSDATAGNSDLDTITFELSKQFVDTWFLVCEAEIKSAIYYMIELEHMIVEGSVGVSIASLIKQQEKFKGKNVVIIISGANISVDTLRKVICK